SFSIARARPPETLVRALNARLPPQVRVLSAAERPAAFHARFDARAKTYRYRLWNGAIVSPFERPYVWHVAPPLHAARMTAAARTSEGRHDFAAFQATGSATPTTEREILTSRIITTEDTEHTEGNNHGGTERNNHRDTETQRRQKEAPCLGVSVVDSLGALG